MKLGMVNYVRDPTPHDNFGAGSATWVVWANMQLVTSLSFFSFFLFLLSSVRAQVASHFWPIATIYAPKRVFSAKDLPFGGLNNIRLHLGGSKNPKKPPKWAGIGISQPNRQTSIIAIDRSMMKIFRQIDYREHYQRNAKLGLRGSWRVTWSTFRILGPPLYLENRWS